MSVSETPVRLGGMALQNGVLVHGPTAWGAAVRLTDGTIKSAAGVKPRLGARMTLPFVRGPFRLAEAFAALVRGREPDRLGPWLKAAQDSPVAALRRFGKRLQVDGHAVRAAVSLDWSNGQTEGQINRLKALKRQMYGRAGLDLLERRFLLAA